MAEGRNFTAGANGIVAHVTASAKKTGELETKLRHLCETVMIADKQIRNDGLGAEDALGLLRDWNYF
jgi:hypothetical protein